MGTQQGTNGRFMDIHHNVINISPQKDTR
jgi:hypothetical protein